MADKLPESPQEWQEIVNYCHWLLHFDAAKQYGLVSGGPEVNVPRCEELLALGAGQGIKPAPDAIEQITRGLAAAQTEMQA